MATVNVHNQNGDSVDKIELSDEVFAAPIKEHLLWEVVTAQRARKRRGTASTKGRSEVKGSRAKIYRQKGTGNARHGARSAPIFVGGGTVFGPKPRSYETGLPKKIWNGALKGALSLRVKEQKLLVLKDFELEELKTKRVALVLERLGVKRGLIVEDKSNTFLAKSARNLKCAKFLAPEGLNVYDILSFPCLVLTETAVRQVEQRLAKKMSRKEVAKDG